MKEYLITFHTNFDAMSLYKSLKSFGKAKMKPVPRELSSSCGTSVYLVIEPEKLPTDWPNTYSFEKIYEIECGKYELKYEQE